MATVNCLLPQDKSKRLCRGPRGQEAGGSGLAGQRATRPAWEGAKVPALGLAQHAPRGPPQAPRQGSQLPRPLGRCVQRPGPRSHREWLGTRSLQIQSPSRRATQCGCSTDGDVPRAGELETANCRTGRGGAGQRGRAALCSVEDTRSGPPTTGETLEPLSPRGPPTELGEARRTCSEPQREPGRPRCDLGLRPPELRKQTSVVLSQHVAAAAGGWCSISLSFPILFLNLEELLRKKFLC